MNINEVENVFKNKELLISQKQNVIKRGDVILGSILKDEANTEVVTKAEGDVIDLENADKRKSGYQHYQRNRQPHGLSYSGPME